MRRLLLARKNCITIFLLLNLIFSLHLFSGTAKAQNLPAMRREQLLNGLRILIWQRPNDPKVILKLRIHAGSAFDLAGKSGMMALLGDALFPDPTTREYFTEELGGRIDVTTDHDALNITLVGRADEFVRIVELLRTALVSTELTPAVTERLKEERIKMLRDMGNAPNLIADRAIAARLFGDFPYGRMASGSADSLSRIDYADLRFARERFLNPNNATLVIAGGIRERDALRVLRQLLGNWRKSDGVIPATFRQLQPPDARTLIIDMPGAETAEVRLATRALARSDRDYAAVTLLTLLIRDRWQATMPAFDRSAFFVRHEAHSLPGMFVMGASVKTAAASQTVTSARNILRSLVETPAPATELERVRSEAIAALNSLTEKPETLADFFLDVDTFKLDAMSSDQVRALSAVTSADVQRVATRLFRDSALATVAVGNSVQLKTDLERLGKVEILGGTLPTTTVKPTPTPTPPPKRP